MAHAQFLTCYDSTLYTWAAWIKALRFSKQVPYDCLKMLIFIANNTLLNVCRTQRHLWLMTYEILWVKNFIKNFIHFINCPRCKIHTSKGGRRQPFHHFYSPPMMRTLELVKNRKDDYCRVKKPLLNIDLGHILIKKKLMILITFLQASTWKSYEWDQILWCGFWCLGIPKSS